MKIEGSEERALWAATAARALGRLVPDRIDRSHSEQLRDVVVEHAAGYADRIVLEYRKRDGSRPA